MKSAIFGLAVLLTVACTAEGGDPCKLSSDCQAGLVCADSVCVTPEALTAAMNPDVTASPDTGGMTDDTSTPTPSDVTVVAPTHPCGDQPYSRQVLECAQSQNIFAAGSAPCPAPAEKYRVSSVVIHKTGGLGPLSTVANDYIASQITGDEPSINIELWRDGTFALNCPGPHAWVTTESDIQGDCTPVYQGRFPITIIGGAIAVVEQAVFDLDTGTLTGVVDRAALVNQLPEELQPVAENLINLDVDLDNDGTMDHASATLTVCF